MISEGLKTCGGNEEYRISINEPMNSEVLRPGGGGESLECGVLRVKDLAAAKSNHRVIHGGFTELHSGSQAH